MIERHILLQETSAGLTFVSNEEACATCPGMCFSPKNSASIDSSQGLPATLAISGSTLNRIALYLFAVPLAGLVTAITLSDAVTNAYPLLQVLPVQLSILALFVALLMAWTRVLRRRWLAIDDGLGVRRSSGERTEHRTHYLEWAAEHCATTNNCVRTQSQRADIGSHSFLWQESGCCRCQKQPPFFCY